MKNALKFPTVFLHFWLLTLGLSIFARAEMVLYYNFDEGGGTRIHNYGSSGAPGDYVGGDREGSWTIGKPGLGRAIELHGGDAKNTWSSEGCGEYGVCSIYDNLPADVRFVDTGLGLGDLNLYGDSTFMAWVRWDGHVAVPLNADLFAVSGRSGGTRFLSPLSANRFLLGFWALDDQINFRVVDFDTNLTVNRIDTDPLPAGYVGEWMHVAFRFQRNEEDEGEGETLQVFVNGEPFLEEEPPFVRSQHSENLQIGFWAWQTFNGVIDEVKLFDEALTDEQILEEMAAPEAPDPGLESVLVYDAGQIPFHPATTNSIRVSNPGGTQPLIIEDVTLSNPEVFQIESYPSQLGPGEVGEVVFTMLPDARARQHHATLSIQSNDQRGPLSTIAVSGSTANLIEGLLTHLTFDDSADTDRLLNSASFGGRATWDGKVIFDAPGLIPGSDRSARFTSGKVRFTDRVEDAFSLSLWLQPTASVTEIQTIAALGELELEWALTLMEGRLAFFLGGNDSPENPDFLSPTEIYDPESPEPFHLAAAITKNEEGIEMRWMINGEPQSEIHIALGTEDAEPWYQSLFVGGFQESFPYQGDLDEVQVYERLLSNEELAQLFEYPGETLATMGEPDSDGDGLLDEEEYGYLTDPFLADTDEDGLNDPDEITLGTDPLKRDSDGGGTWDGVEVDDGTDPLSSDDDRPIWTIEALSLREFIYLDDLIERSVEDLSLLERFIFQRREIDIQEDMMDPPYWPEVFPGGENLKDLGITSTLSTLLLIKGSIVVKQAGNYTLGITSRGAVRLLVDDLVEFEREENAGGINPVAVFLTAGVHQVEVQWIRRDFLEIFHWEEPGDFTASLPLEEAVLLQTAHVDDVDTDGDALPDYWEQAFFGNLDQGAEADPDEDELTNLEEFQRGSNPLEEDTDGDGLSDWDEINRHSTNPLIADTDGDGLNDRQEIEETETDPFQRDTDGDGLPDGFEVARELDPLGMDDDSLSFQALHYGFEEGEGTEVANLVGEAPGTLYSWDIGSAWGMASDSDSRGSGFLRILAIDDEAQDPEQHLYPGDPNGGPGTLVATGLSAEDGGEGGEDHYTFMAWVRMNPYSGLGLGRLFSQEDNQGMLLGFNRDRLLLSHGSGDRFQWSSFGIPYEAWHHVAWRYDNGHVTFFLDGRNVGEIVNRTPLANPEAEFLLGSWRTGSGMQGGVDDVRYYHAPLTEQKIQSLAGLPEERDPLEITLIRRIDEGIQLSWRGEEGDGRYIVEFSSTLTGDWVVIETLGATTYLDDDDARSHGVEGFYRVRVE